MQKTYIYVQLYSVSNNLWWFTDYIYNANALQALLVQWRTSMKRSSKQTYSEG